MIKLQGKLPRQLWLACSGGVDSMAALDFLCRNHQVNVLHFNHNTAHGEQAQAFVERQCAIRGLPLTVGECLLGQAEKHGGESKDMSSLTNFLLCQ